MDLANSECEAVKDHLERMESGILQSQENHREFMDDLELSGEIKTDSEGNKVYFRQRDGRFGRRRAGGNTATRTPDE